MVMIGDSTEFESTRGDAVDVQCGRNFKATGAALQPRAAQWIPQAWGVPLPDSQSSRSQLGTISREP